MLPKGSLIVLPQAEGDEPMGIAVNEDMWVLSTRQMLWYRMQEAHLATYEAELARANSELANTSPKPHWWQEPLVIGGFVVSGVAIGVGIGVLASQ